MNGRSRLLLAGLLAGATALALTLTGCSAPGQGNGSAGKKSSGPIKIAVIDAQSGQYSPFGDYEYKGAKLAFDEANKAGGISGRKIKLSLYDTQGDPTTATNLARKAASNGAIAVIGPALSAPTLAALPIFNQERLPFITSATSPALVDKGSPYLFLNSPESTTFDQTLADYIKGRFTSIAMISNNGTYGVGEHDSFLAAIGKFGQKPVADEVVTPDQKQFSSALSVIREAKPDALFIGTEDVQAGLIAKQARESGIDATIIGAIGVSTANYVAAAGKSAADGSIASTPYIGNDESAASKKFAAAYQKAFGKEATYFSAKAYDGATILIKALKKTDVATGKKLADAIHGISYTGLVGDFHFDKNGVGVHKTKIGVIKNGHLVAAQKE